MTEPLDYTKPEFDWIVDYAGRENISITEAHRRGARVLQVFVQAVDSGDRFWRSQPGEEPVPVQILFV